MDRDGFNGTKSYITQMNATANATINSTLTNTSPGAGNQTQTLISGIKHLKDSVVMIVKITAHLMDGLDLLKNEKDTVDTLSKMITNITALMM